MGDGTVISYHISISSMTEEIQLSNKRRIVIGTRPISFHSFMNNQHQCIFVSCDRSTIIYNHNDQLIYSTVNYNDIITMTSFQSELLMNSLCFVLNQSLMIGTIDSIQKIQIQNKRLSGIPRRIVYLKELSMYALILEQTTATQEVIHIIQFINENTFELIYQFQLDSLENELIKVNKNIESLRKAVGSED
jgi:DNA damage-binding protein 1